MKQRLESLECRTQAIVLHEDICLLAVWIVEYDYRANLNAAIVANAIMKLWRDVCDREMGARIGLQRLAHNATSEEIERTQ